MLAKIKSITTSGIEGFVVEVEVDIGKGIPGISVVGLPEQSIKESRDRIKPAIRNSGYEFPNRKIIVNLAPADLRKEGSHFDLPIAIGIMTAEGKIPEKRVSQFYFVGELALDGSLRPVKGALPMALKLKEVGGENLILPEENVKEAGIVKEINVFGVKSLKECVEFLKGEKEIKPFKVNVEEIFRRSGNYGVDFKEVKGQRFVKRAIEVAVSGFHNILMIGSPGAGKSMIASRVPTILPPLTFEEALQITKIYSVAGLLDKPLLTERPFRSPHHTISDIAMIGGGTIPKPGEISLSHNGVLFLDEFPEYRRDVLEALREPLENGKVSISRAKGRVEFPAKFLLIAAMNPCPCGWYGDESHSCNCTLSQIIKYRKKISGPLLDRIDIHIEVSSLPGKFLLEEKEEESSEEIRKRVIKAWEIQQERFKGMDINFNSHMRSAEIKKFCAMDKEGKKLLEEAMEKLNFSARSYDKIRKVARTIADLDNSDIIRAVHISEAIGYRTTSLEDLSF
ncbi:YifB family Mg chelatase-like AAA ATPase [bacterium]|nr:YifB family Mg chelatase-like AAA ATPase [bacterium]